MPVREATARFPWSLGLTALILTIGLMAMAASDAPPSPARIVGTAQPLPFTCELRALAREGGRTLEGRIVAREAVTGSFDMRLPGLDVTDQRSGVLSLAAGEIASTGTVELPGRLGDAELQLTVTWRGRDVTCPLVAG